MLISKLRRARRDRARWATVILGAAVAGAIATPTVRGDIWDNTSGDGLWSTPANWVDNGEPGSADPVIFPTPIPGSFSVTLAAGELAQQLTFDANYILNNGNLTLTNGNVIANSSATINSVLLGTAGLTKTGPGTIVLNGTNTFTGAVAINTGAIQIGDDSGLGNAANGVTINGGTLGPAGNITSARTYTLGASGGTFQIAAGVFTLTSPLAANANSLTKNGPATMVLGAASTRTGASSITQGTLQLTNGAGLGTGTTTLSGSGVLQLVGTTVTQPITLQTGSVLTATGTAGYFGTMSVANGHFVSITSGASTTFTLGNGGNDVHGGDSNSTIALGGSGVISIPFTNDYNGKWIVNSGTVRVANGRAFNLGASNIVCNGGILEIANVGLERVVTLNNGSGMRGTGPFATALGNIDVGVSGPATVALETGASAADFLVMNGITGTTASTINVGGSGTVRLPFNTSFGGVWNVNSGTLRVDNAASLGTGTSTVNLASGATLLLNNATVARAVALDHGATLIGAATGGITGAVSMGGSDQVTFNASAASDVLNVAGGITGGAGSSTITVPGAGIVSLSQPSTWAGVWIVNSSRLRMTNQNQLGPSFNDVQLNGTSTLLVNGTTTSDHAVRVVASTIDVTTGNTLTLTKQLTGSGPGPTLTKTGGGMLTLAAGSNFSVGGMTVSGGVLRMGGAWSSGSFTVGAAALETNQTFTNAITLNNGATLRSGGGSATHNGVNTIASGANVTLGTSAASEVLTFGSGLPFTGGGGGAVINISGPGRVAINQMNNVTAAWKINTGATLQIANNNRLGNVANSVTLDGGTLETTASASLSRPFTFNAGTIRVNTGGLGLSGAITAGPLGGFIKTGPGILYLGGTQTFPIGTSINVNEGTLTITSDPGFGTPRAVYLLINNGSLDLAGSTMQLDTLYMADGTTGTMSPFGARSTLVVNSFSLSGNARIDVAKNNVVVRANSVGTPEDGVYGDITGMIQSAYNGGAWDGPGLTTSMADALSGLTTLGVASADETGRTGSLFGGVTLESGDVIVAYTYSGDANLDGFISGDDYSAIDFNVGTAVSGWYNGDFNYDGIVSGDDYSTIDFNYAAQGDPFNFGSAAGGAAAGMTAVPEPAAAVGILLLTPIFALSRRRRRRVDSTQTCV